ncbi:MAG: peptide-methionine (S)-S-oxide reductase [Ignavibacteriae bacterium HGW-Ignavibacteriae-4]|nr:MAG: peptide-methionine (S)-S-oxide reductase [Ignavibacteriae bacterium HGW-Ignavibacteriae-4]
MIKRIIIIFAILISATACTNADDKTKYVDKEIMSNTIDTAIFASGCFWCTEAIFQELEGVEKVESGYIGGEKADPTYEEVCTGNTGHAEATRIYYNPELITFKELLEVFWKTHDPTTLNRQGNDVGTQYRSGIFYLNDNQKNLAEEYKKKLNDAGIYEDPIITEITHASEFFVAEDYHQNYYNQNGNQPYCSFVITPKIEKFKKVFGDKLKK